MKIARFKAIDCQNLVIVLEVENSDTRDGYIRVSEVIDVDFPPVTTNVAEQLAAIDAERAKAAIKYESTLARLNAKKAELQATLPEEVAA